MTCGTTCDPLVFARSYPGLGNAMEGVQRRLSAIVCADVAGYSRLMGQDESGTLAALRAHREELWRPKVIEHGGRIAGSAGDSLLTEFPSVVAAVRCAVEIQGAMRERNAAVPQKRHMLLRIGVNVGEVLVEDETIYGDEVNVAARLQEIAAPGGVCISDRVHDDVRDRLEAAFTDGGEPQLKNIARPVRIWRWSPTGSSAPSLPAAAEPPPPLPDLPSIAVLPFANLSGDPEQAYFADGMAEDITTALSRFPALFVIARNSSFTYRGRAVDVRQVGRELGVRYVLEGSVRKAGRRVRVAGQLIEASSGNHLWAEQYDGDLGDIFALQDRITEAVAGAIAPSIVRAEIERARRSRPRSFDAYDLRLRALPLLHELTRESNARALDLYEQAIQADPTFVPALIGASSCWGQRREEAWAPAAEALSQSLAYAQRALRLDPNNADTLARVAVVTTLGRGYGLTRAGLDEAVAMVSRAVTLNPNSASALRDSGWVHVLAAEPETAILHLERALRLSPKDLANYFTWNALVRALLQVGRDQDAIIAAQTALQYAPNATVGWIGLAGAQALAGRLHEARAAATRLLELQPAFRIGEVRTVYERINPATHFRLLDGLCLAGLPE